MLRSTDFSGQQIVYHGLLHAASQAVGLTLLATSLALCGLAFQIAQSLPMVAPQCMAQSMVMVTDLCRGVATFSACGSDGGLELKLRIEASAKPSHLYGAAHSGRWVPLRHGNSRAPPLTGCMLTHGSTQSLVSRPCLRHDHRQGKHASGPTIAESGKSREPSEVHPVLP